LLYIEAPLKADSIISPVTGFMKKKGAIKSVHLKKDISILFNHPNNLHKQININTNKG